MLSFKKLFFISALFFPLIVLHRLNRNWQAIKPLIIVPVWQKEQEKYILKKF